VVTYGDLFTSIDVEQSLSGVNNAVPLPPKDVILLYRNFAMALPQRIITIHILHSLLLKIAEKLAKLQRTSSVLYQKAENQKYESGNKY
jgi:hypothetical protein